MDDTGAKLGSDRDYRKETQSDEFGRSRSDPNLVSIACKPPKVVVRRALIQ